VRGLAVVRVCGSTSSAAGRFRRAGPPAGHARQPHGEHVFRHAELCRQETSSPHRRRPAAAGGDDEITAMSANLRADDMFDIPGIAAAGLTAIVLYLLGVMLFHLIGLPAPVAMLFLAVAAKLSSAVSPRLQSGGLIVYRFAQIATRIGGAITVTAVLVVLRWIT